jgi:hypothetical protein
VIADRPRLVGGGAGPRPLVLVGSVVALIVIGHAVALTRPADEASPIVIATHLYALVVLAGLLWLACALGKAILRRCGIHGESRLEHAVFAVAIGFGLIASAVVGLGLVQLLTRPVLCAMVVAIAMLVRRDLVDLASAFPDVLRAALDVRRSLREHGPALALLVPLSEVLFVALLLRALVPPGENDVLTYHLQGPNRFLELGGLVPLPDIQQANMPLAVNMLYLLGLAFGSDELAGVLHLTLSGLLAASTFSFGRRFFGERVGWIAATTFVSTQLLLVIATVAFVDYGLALFDFLAVYAFIVWRDSGRRGWLVASGMMVGCALASKYLGAITAVSLGVWLLVLAFRYRPRLGIAGVVGLLVAFALPAGLIAAPWYVKNVVWFGNPVWPFLAGNPNDFNMYLGATTHFTGTSGILGPLLLPVYLYSYGSFELPMVRPPLQLLVIPLYVLMPKHRVVTTLLCLATVHFLVWSQGAHLLRYLLQALPALSIVAAYILGRLVASETGGAMGRRLAAGVMLIGLAVPTIFAVAVVFTEGPMTQLVGLESRQVYLERKVANHSLVTFLNEREEGVIRVLMIGDNRSYYLRQPAWVDVSMEVFQSVVLAPDARTARERLAERGISHVMVNSNDLFFYLPIDPERRILSWWDRFEAGRSGYLIPIATSRDSTLYRVVP